jgi:tetratricopeptide (TPR) repeat protein
LTAKESKEDELIGAAYLSIGIVYYENRDLVNALNHYVEANNYLIKTNNEYQAHKVKFSIAQTKYYLGFYLEAIALLNDCKTYYKEDNQMAYVKTLHALVLCFLNSTNKCNFWKRWDKIFFQKREEKKSLPLC